MACNQNQREYNTYLVDFWYRRGEQPGGGEYYGTAADRLGIQRLQTGTVTVGPPITIRQSGHREQQGIAAPSRPFIEEQGRGRQAYGLRSGAGGSVSHGASWHNPRVRLTQPPTVAPTTRGGQTLNCPPHYHHIPSPSSMTSTVDDSSATPIPRKLYNGELNDDEIWWRDHQVWLQERGYMLRPRYRPDWVPSWHQDERKFYNVCEDGKFIMVSIWTLRRMTLSTQYTIAARCNSGRHPYR